MARNGCLSAVGDPLPQLQLWLGLDLCVPLDLETTYQMTCTDLRVRLASLNLRTAPDDGESMS